MKKAISKSIFVLLLTSSVIFGCKEKEIHPAPTISFLTGGHYISGNYAAYAGEGVLIGLTCKSNGIDGLRRIVIYEGEEVKFGISVPDSLVDGFTLDSITIMKSKDQTEEWLFEIVDTQEESSYITLTLSLNSLGGPIIVTGDTIGLQDNTTENSYFSCKYYSTYSLTAASVNQSVIDMIGAYVAADSVCLYSPNAANLPSPYSTALSSWNTKNNTLFYKTNLFSEQFDNISVDFMLTSSFPTNTNYQKSVAKNLKTGDVYAFKLSDGRYGLFKVTTITNGVSGRVGIAIKVQPSSKK